MCSIFGAVLGRPLRATQRVQLQELVSCLALAGASRGRDATGVGVVWSEKRYAVLKDAVSSYQMVQRHDWKALCMPDETPLVIMGHTRARTHGANTQENAHPFAFDDEAGTRLRVMGTHNGTVTNFARFGSGKYDVDSACLFEGLAKATTRKELGQTLYSIQGSYALAFLHNNTFYLARNPGSSCVVARVESMDAWVYASTEHMLRLAASAAGVRIDNLRTPRAGRLYSFNWRRNSWHTRVYETFDELTGQSVGYGRLRAPKTRKVKSTCTSYHSGECKEVITYSDDTQETTFRYECLECKVVAEECTTRSTVCNACLRQLSFFKERSTLPKEATVVSTSAFDHPDSISDERLAELLDMLRKGAYVPCTKCHQVYPAAVMQRSKVVRGVLCNACESAVFTLQWLAECKTTGGTFCTKCMTRVEKITLRLKPVRHMLCPSCDGEAV